MAKKKFETDSVFDQFFTPVTHVTDKTEKTHEMEITPSKASSPAAPEVQKEESAPVVESKKGSIGRPKKRGDTYRFSLYLDLELEKYVRYAVWRDRKDSSTTYFNDLVRKDMEEHLKNGGSKSDWESF